MKRTLRPGPRPYIALGVALGAVAMVAMFPLFRAGKRWQAAQSGGAMLVVYGALCLAISRQKIEVQSDGLAFHELFKPTNRVHFSDISKSIPRTLAEPEHPVRLDIYTRN